MYYIKIIYRRVLLGKIFIFKYILCIFRLYDFLIYNRKGYKKRFCYYFKIINNKNLGSFGL